MLTNTDTATILSLAEKWNVRPDIHPDDFIFRFVYENPVFASKDAAIQYYFNDGQIDYDGFWFKAASEQKDLDVSQYGLTCTLPGFVLAQLFRTAALELIYFRAGYWWKHQDLYVIQIKQRESIVPYRLSPRNRIMSYIKRLLK